MADLFDEPAGDFEWGPDSQHWRRLLNMLPYLAVIFGSASLAIGLALL